MSIRINALPAKKLLLFDGVRRFLPNPVDSSRLLFTGSFVEYGSTVSGRHTKEQRHELTIPLSFLSMFNNRSHWRDQQWFNQSQVSKKLRYKSSRVQSHHFKDQILYEFADEGDGLGRKSHLLPPSEAKNLPKDAKLSWFGELPIGRVRLGWDEFVRFYLSSFGLLLNDIMKCAQDGGNLEHICYPERTRIVDRTLFIAPRAHIRDRGSILLLGMLVGDDALRYEVFRIARFVAGDAHGFQAAPYVPDFPKGSDSLYVQYVNGDEDMKVSSSPLTKYKSITKIRSDFRASKFDQIVAELSGNHHLPVEEPSDEEELEELVRSFADDDLRLSSLAIPGRHSVSVPLPWQNFRDGFPAYRKAKVLLSHVDPPTLVAVFLPKELDRITHIDVTDSQPRSGRDTEGPAGLRRSSRTWIDPPAAEKQLLANADAIEAPIPIWVNPAKLSPLLRRFWNAAGELGGCEHRLGAQAICYQIPSSWGSFSQTKQGRIRHFIYTSISTDTGTAYAVDFDREDRGLPTSLGIIAKNDGTPMSPQEIFACVKSAVSHVSQKERHAGKHVRLQTIWPNAAIYADVRSTTLKHLRALMEDMDLLVNALAAAANHLLTYRCS